MSNTSFIDGLPPYLMKGKIKHIQEVLNGPDFGSQTQKYATLILLNIPQLIHTGFVLTDEKGS